MSKNKTQDNIYKIYRYEIQYSDSDGNYTQVLLREYPVLRETEHTYFIDNPRYSALVFDKKEKQVRKDAMNTFAYNTKEKAKENFIRRTTTRLSWYKYWIKECKKGLKLIKNE